MDDMSLIISEFLTESYENLDQLDRDLVDLEAHPGEKSLLASIFRTIHTIKGTCGFLGFSKLESVVHVGENLLSKLRDGELDMTPDIVNALLRMVDAVREILSNVEKDHSEGHIDYSDLVELMTVLQSGGTPESEQIESDKNVDEITARSIQQPAAPSTTKTSETVNPVIHEFLAESYENLKQLDRDLAELEANPGKESLLASIFRTVHAIKGACGFLGFTKLESIAHVGEALLRKLMGGELDMTPEIADSLLAMVDAVRDILSSIENDHSEGDTDYSNQVELMAYLQSGRTPEPANMNTLEAVPNKHTLPAQEPAEPSIQGTLFERMGGQKAVDTLIDKFFDKVLVDQRVKQFFTGVDTERLRNKKKSYWAFALDGEPQYSGKTLAEAHQPLQDMGLADKHFAAMIEIFNDTLREMDIAEDVVQEVCKIALSTRDEILSRAPERSAKSVPASGDAAVTDEVKKPERRDMDGRRTGNKEAEAAYLANHNERRSGGDRRTESIRVGVNLLDRLMNLVGELVLTRNQIVQYTATQTDTSIISTTQHLSQLTAELQEGVMKTRMQPIDNIWSKFPRVVRDLAQSCNKNIQLNMAGKDTELDKTVIEAIRDPLTHILRNSVDHGIETPEERIANGKNPEGRISLHAYHEGGQVNIEIADDGGGIDPEKVKQKAVSKKLITPQEADRMSDRELINLIFSQGFSTAETVSHISGRGVGMDVVRSNIEKIGGTVDIQSNVGQGTTLQIKIPLTLAIVPVLIVTCGDLRYAIPQVNLAELVRLEANDGESPIEYIQGSPVYRLRGNLLPLVYLNKVLDVESQSNSDAANIVVLQSGFCQFGLVVDQIKDTEEIVVKPLGRQLKGVTTYAGATIMGDGKVVLILDSMGLAQKSNVADQEGRDHVRKEISEPEEFNGANRQALLVFSAGSETRMAVPLSMVGRLEEFNKSMLENSDGKQVVQYRGDIMPLIFLSDVFGLNTSREEEDTLSVIVYSDQGRNVGVVVDKIIDIVEEVVTLKEGVVGQNLLGSTVVRDKVTDLLDVEGVIRRVDPDFYKNQTVATSNNIE